MTSWSLVSVVRGRLTGDDRERGSLPFLALVMIVCASLGAVLLTTVVSQASTSRFDETRVHSLDAAQAGIDHVLALIRSAVSADDATLGDAGALPCGGWDDVRADSSDTSTFTASVAYYRVNPAALDDAARASQKMICASSGGPFDRASNSRAPKFALIVSFGRDNSRAGSGASKGRRVETVYNFQTNDVNISGGQIRVYGSDSCMDAGDAPAVGTAVTLQPCINSTPPPEKQVWSYRSDLSIELVSSAVAVSGQPVGPGLCIDSSSLAADVPDQAAGQPLVLNRCGVADPNPRDKTATSVCPAGTTPGEYASKNPGRSCANSPWHQRWSVDDNAHLRGSRMDQGDVNGLCIDAPAPGAGLFLQGCAGGTTDGRQTWVPADTAGAGAAGAGNEQLVNYAQFATCLDVTGQNVSASYLILYTCKQNPRLGAVRWNQRFVPSPALDRGPTLTKLTTTVNGTTYCLRSPLTAGGYPVLSSTCPSTPVGEFGWTVAQRYQSGGPDTPELAYGDRYTIKDSVGRCLSLGARSDRHSSFYYKAVTGTCTGSTSQKWNADPSSLKANLTNTRETG
ncbi:MAG: hypothetical protein Q7T56_01200 [Nocardioidaceae bacterium]|nr:hypothetical protein [Nocardioidaceae bacterium]